MTSGAEAQSYKGKRVLVTGGLGFIGSAIAAELVRLRANVTIVDRCLEGSGANRFNIEQLKESVIVQVADIADATVMRPLIEQSDIVFNASGFNNHLESMERPEKDLYANVSSQLAFLGACAEVHTSAVIVFLGTRTQYGKVTVDPVPEDTPQRPTDIHGMHKQLAENYHLLFQRTRGLRTVSARLVNTYGPRQPLHPPNIGLIPGFILAVLQNSDIEIFGSSKRMREILYIDDAVDAVLRLALASKAVGECYNVGGSVATMGEIAEGLIESAGKGRVIIRGFPKEVEQIEVGNVRLDSSKIEQLCGWKANTLPAEGLRRTIAYYSQHYKEYTTL